MAVAIEAADEQTQQGAFYVAITTHTTPWNYRGDAAERSLMGQLALHEGYDFAAHRQRLNQYLKASIPDWVIDAGPVTFLAEHYQVPRDLVQRLWTAETFMGSNYDRALNYAYLLCMSDMSQPFSYRNSLLLSEIIA